MLLADSIVDDDGTGSVTDLERKVEGGTLPSEEDKITGLREDVWDLISVADDWDLMCFIFLGDEVPLELAVFVIEIFNGGLGPIIPSIVT